MALKVDRKQGRLKTKTRVKSEDIDGRGTGERPYAWLHRSPTIEETRARKGHRKLPPLSRREAPQVLHRRRLTGGRPAVGMRKPIELERRIRRAHEQGRERVELRPGDVKTLVELYDRMQGRSHPSVMWLRAGVRGIIGRVEELEGEMRAGSRVGRRLRKIVEHGYAVLKEDEGGDDGKE